MIYAIHDILMTYLDGWLAFAICSDYLCGGRSFAFQQSSFIFYFTWYLDEVDEKYPSRKCNCAFVQNHVSLLQHVPVSFLECLLQILRFDSICRLIVEDQQHAPVFATFSHKLELALDESGSTRNSIQHNR
jgi:hypothetical protein